jgi:DNA-binding NarL/FixJ family response regulator
MLEQSHDFLSVLIVDDHVLLREALCAVLSQEHDFEVVGWIAPEGAQALAKALQPDFILLAIASGTPDWLALAKQLLEMCPTTHVTIFTNVENENLLFDAVRIGVHGYLYKTLSASDMLTALRSISQGKQVVIGHHTPKPELSQRRRISNEQHSTNVGLSAKDIEILRLAAQGNNNREIGAHLYWSEVTIKRRMQEIYQKLHAKDRAQAVAEALRLGLI